MNTHIRSYIKALKNKCVVTEKFRDMVTNSEDRYEIYEYIKKNATKINTQPEIDDHNEQLLEKFKIYLRRESSFGYDNLLMKGKELYSLFSSIVEENMPFLPIEQNCISYIQMNLRVMIIKYVFDLSEYQNCPLCGQYRCSVYIDLFADMPNCYCYNCLNYIYGFDEGFLFEENPVINACNAMDTKSFMMNV